MDWRTSFDNYIYPNKSECGLYSQSTVSTLNTLNLTSVLWLLENTLDLRKYILKCIGMLESKVMLSATHSQVVQQNNTSDNISVRMHKFGQILTIIDSRWQIVQLTEQSVAHVQFLQLSCKFETFQNIKLKKKKKKRSTVISHQSQTFDFEQSHGQKQPTARGSPEVSQSVLSGPVSAQDCLGKSKESVDRGTEVKVVFHRDCSTNTLGSWPLQKGPPGTKDTIHSGRSSPPHGEVSQKPALLGSPPVFTLFFEGSLTHQEGVNCVARASLAATRQAPQLLLSHSSACSPSPSPRKESCRKRAAWVWVCLTPSKSKKASNLEDQCQNKTPS